MCWARAGKPEQQMTGWKMQVQARRSGKSLPLFCGSSLQSSTSNAPQQANYPLDPMVLHRQTLIISGIHPARNVQKNPRSWPIPPNIASGVGISIVYRSLLRVVHHVFSKTIPAVRFFSFNQCPPVSRPSPQYYQQQPACLGNLNHRPTLDYSWLRPAIIKQ